MVSGFTGDYTGSDLLNSTQKWLPYSARIPRRFAAHALGGFAYEGQADAGSFGAFVELLEHLKDAVLIFRRDAGTLSSNQKRTNSPLASAQVRMRGGVLHLANLIALDRKFE